jgi:glycosyltransferase involved in cell wall biosynthesis
MFSLKKYREDLLIRSSIVYFPSLKIKEKIIEKDHDKFKILYSKPKFPINCEAYFDNNDNYQNSKNIKVCWIGTYNAQKNPYLLLETAELLGKKVNLHFEFFGAGPLESELREYVKNNNLSNFVKINQHKQDIWSYIKDFHAVISTSHNEAFGRVLAECARIGLIPVFAKESSWNERFIDGYTGVSFLDENKYDLARALLSIKDLNFRLSIRDNLKYEQRRNYGFKEPESIITSDIAQLLA